MFEQNGDDRAAYGTGLLKRVATDLTKRGISGCAVRMLERMRVFYNTYPQVQELISSPAVTISQHALKAGASEISSPLVTKSLPNRHTPRPLPVQMLLQLSWTHLVDLLAFVSRYLVALPKPEELEQLIETDRAAWNQTHGLGSKELSL